MELNRNKIILFVATGAIVFIIMLFMIIGMYSNSQKPNNNSNSTDAFTIWTLGEDTKNISVLIDDFKAFSKTKKEVLVTNFNNYEEYSLALTHAIASKTGPDIFVLNNNEKNSLFENQVIGISPKVISVADFRREYKTFFEQLIDQTEDSVEFLLGVPIGYETLGIFYNRKKVAANDIADYNALKNKILELKKQNKEYFPIGIGTGTNVKYSEDIFTNFLMTESGERTFESVSLSSLKKALLKYKEFGSVDYENGFDISLQEGLDSIKGFANGEIFMLVGYPRLINELKTAGVSRNTVLASYFPSSSKNGYSLVNYNYFVMNIDSANSDLANTFMQYLVTDAGQQKVLEAFPYYLPAKLTFDSKLSEQLINSDYPINISSFYSEGLEYTSFDKGIKTLYDKKIKEILDKPYNVNTSSRDGIDVTDLVYFQKYIKCVLPKVLTLSNLEANCE